MKSLLSVIFYFMAVSCADNTRVRVEAPSKDTVIVKDTVFFDSSTDWQSGFGLTHNPELDSVWGKPVSYYINNPRCDPAAKDFYLGVLPPSDNNTTTHLLSLVTTKDESLRPFYRWILNKTIMIQDGALAEYTGVPARLYAQKYPREFFEYVDIDTSGQKYSEWTAAIAYSGFLEGEDYKKMDMIRNRVSSTMAGNCKACPESMLSRIKTFAKDCFK
jgi:hypothetical protein